MVEKNGYVKWWQLVTASLTIVGLIITLGLFAATQAIAIDERALDRYKENRELIGEMLDKNNEAHTVIIADIREIKTWMGIKNGTHSMSRTSTSTQRLETP